MEEKAEIIGEEIEVKTPEYRINFIRPCLTDRKKKMADAKLLGMGIDPKDMVELLMNCRQFDNVSYSEKLGVARIEWQGKTIMVFNTGEITIRSAESIEDVKNTVERICSILSRLKPAGKAEEKSRQYRPGEQHLNPFY